MPASPARVVQAAIGRALPESLLAAAIRAVYPRVEPELRQLTSLVPAGGTAVDVGAWYGPWTARLLRRADQVVAFEPNPHLASLLRDRFPAARVIAAAASRQAGEATLAVPGAGRGGSATASIELVPPGAPVITVPTMAIDDLGLRDVRFVKLDVEGHELSALRGAERTVRRDRPVLLVELEQRHQPIEPAVALLAGWGYRGHVLPGRTWLPLEEFDLAGHQRAAAHLVRQSFLRRVLLPGQRYVNSVLFRC